MLLKLKKALEVFGGTSSSSRYVLLSEDDVKERNENTEPSSTAHSSPESSIDEDDFSDVSYDNYNKDHSPVEEIEEIIDFLYRFLNTVKKTNSNIDITKVINFRAKHANAGDDEELEKFIRWSINQELPNSSSALTT